LLSEVNNDRQLVEELYIKVLSRQPTRQELKVCLDYRRLRARRRWRSLDEKSDGYHNFELATAKWVRNPSQVLENKELLGHITAAIDELPAQQRAVVIMHEIEGLSKKTISEVLDCSMVTVRTNLHHARRKLRKKLLVYLRA